MLRLDGELITSRHAHNKIIIDQLNELRSVIIGTMPSQPTVLGNTSALENIPQQPNISATPLNRDMKSYEILKSSCFQIDSQNLFSHTRLLSVNYV